MTDSDWREAQLPASVTRTSTLHDRTEMAYADYVSAKNARRRARFHVGPSEPGQP